MSFARILAYSLRLLVSSFRTVEGEIALLFFLVLICNKRAAQHMSNWDGISPWWALVPVVIVFIYSLIKSHISTEKERDSLLEEVGRTSQKESIPWNKDSVHTNLSGTLISLSLVGVGIAVGTEFMVPENQYKDWRFVSETDSEGWVTHELVDGDGKPIARLTESRWRFGDITVTSEVIPPEEQTDSDVSSRQ